MKENSLENKKILIVGGAGFIGHNLAPQIKTESRGCIADGLTVNNLYSLNNNVNQLPYPELVLKIIKERQKLLNKAVPTHYSRCSGVSCFFKSN